MSSVTPRMYIRKIEAMNVPFKFETAHAQAEETALIDSGATENFIDEESFKRLGVGKRTLPRPVKMINVDGTENRQGEVKNFCRLRVLHNAKEALQDFYITDLGKDRIILGYPFLEAFNPKINWTQGRLEGGRVTVQSAIYKHLDKVVKRFQEKARLSGTLQADEAFYVRRTTIAQKMAQEYTKNDSPTIEIPNEYQKYSKVFSEKEARKFPPNREPNATIQLKEGAPDTINCKVYPLNSQETETLKKFLEEEISKGFISEAASPYTSPIFFIGKKNSTEKRMVIDYKRVNQWTVRDNGPLTRIETLLQQLNGKRIFSKFDIRWGYNNIPIETADRWKAAFKTPLGTFQPNVLYFGMQNAPAFFVRLMFRDFRPWLNKWCGRKKTVGGFYMDDFYIASSDDEEGKEGHQECTHDLLGLMEKHHYFLRPAKCVWAQPQMELLGLQIEEGGQLRIDPAKMEGISQWPRILKN